MSKNPAQILSLPAKRDSEPKSHLPTKRKRDSICGLGSFNKPFVIKSCPESLYDKPETFKPIRTIGRSQLPLTFLDTSLDANFTPNGLFSANIDILDQQHEVQNEENASPKVLIARYETNKALYAIERVRPRVFALCKLAWWLKEKDVADLWDPSGLSSYPTFPKQELAETDQGYWWQQAAVSIGQGERLVKRARISMLRPKLDPVVPESKLQVQKQEPGATEVRNLDTAVQQTTEIHIEAPSAQQLVEGFVQHYLDAVYLSKMSLAYFAKGPITRVRTAFTSPDEGAPPTHELVTFLRSMLLSHKASEKKYHEKLPDVIRSIPPGCFSDDDLGMAALKSKKSKKKTKLSREGVYPQEEDVVKRWWLSEMHNREVYGEETIDQHIKRRIGDLRVRETLAQMILMLEVIALEALSTYKPPPEEEQSAIGDPDTQRESRAKPKKRRKKLDDVKLQLDLLLDKLCIWQSVDQEGILEFDARGKQDDAAASSGRMGGSDRLQNFCVEVIVPFYMNRLPEQALMINKKLGGPVHTSPPKRKAMKPPTTSRKSGEPKEPDAKKSRRALERVATDTIAQNTQQRPKPSLTRSSTEPALLDRIKREPSEVPLAVIPFQRSPSNAARQSMSQLRHLKGRQIDLSAPSAAAVAKLKQKKRVEEDLKEAITALKRPNRNLAAGNYIDDIERRGLGVTTKSKKPATTARKVLKDVQVSATPRAVRTTKDMIERTPSHQRNPFVRNHTIDTPPTSNFCIPSSGVVPRTVQRSATARKLTGAGVAETPSKAPSSRLFEDQVARRRTNSPSLETEAVVLPAVFATPTKGTAVPPSEITSMPPITFATPIKGSAAIAVSESPLPTLPQKTKDHEEQSIYDALGWNDDDDDLY